MAEWLIARGANANARNYEGKTPLRVATDMNRDAVAEVLRALGGAE